MEQFIEGGDRSEFPGGSLFHKISQQVASLPPSNIQKKGLRILSWFDKIYDNFKEDRADVEKSRYILPALLNSFAGILNQYMSMDEIQGLVRDKEKFEIKVMESLELLQKALRHHLNGLFDNNRISLEVEINLLNNLIRSEGLDYDFSSGPPVTEINEIQLTHSTERELIVRSGVVLGRREGRHTAFFAHMKYVSGHHAELHCRNGIWYLRDPGSTNRTKLNGDFIQNNRDYIVQDGDAIVFADEEFIVHEL